MLNVMALISYPHIDPVIFKIGPVAVRWYGMAYLTGFVLAYFVLLRLVRTRELPISADALSDLVGWLALGVVGGGRLGYWIFYHKPELGEVEPWWEPIAIWHGGMSFHGGLVGVMLVLFIWTRYKKLSFLQLADCMALVTPIGLCLGRIANFINAELVGRESSVPWAMIFPGYTRPRHPSQIYEAILEGPLLLGLVWAVRSWKNRRIGQIAASFVVFYGILRFAVEFTREPDKQLGYVEFGWLTRGQELSILIGLAGLIWWVSLQLRGKRYEPPAPVTTASRVSETPTTPPASPRHSPGPR
ncbi:MAG: prolipoprotein diacylglyceryl transferase [Planctomycetota bacterium]|nr:prolipoprotein diacylglyceryl transferase [Planctomycetota bacterium]